MSIGQAISRMEEMIVNRNRSFSSTFINVEALPHHIHNIELQQQSDDIKVRQYADNNLEQEKNNQRIARKLLRQWHVTVHHKHFNAHPIYEIRCQKISSKEDTATAQHCVMAY